MKTAEDLVQGQLDAYNNHDIETFCTYFAQDIKVYDAHDQTLLFEGMELFHERYSKTLSNPKLHCQLINRMVHDNIVIDQESVTGFEDELVQAIAIYHTKDGLIQEVHFY